MFAANGDSPPSTFLIITIFAQTNIDEALPPAVAANFLMARTLGIEHQTKLSPRVLRLCHLYPSNSPSASVLRHDPEVALLENNHSVEVVLHLHADKLEAVAHLPLKLAVFDMDSTLINQEVIDELARSIGVTPSVAAITERAMAGELDFEESLKARVKLLKGVEADVWTDLKESITFAEGAPLLCRALARIGVKMAVLSGGFIPMADWAKGELGLDHAHANHLVSAPPSPHHPYPHLTGDLHPTHPIITAAAKRSLLLSYCETYKVPLAQTLCVGDGANDLDMLKEVGEGGGWGIAFKAKKKVQEMAPQKLNSESLVDLMFLFGYRESEIGEMTKDSRYLRG
ncbi:hypothetical protein MMC30_005854 [Trapelia coarctata]|nr:hypothetical protein [Trapelia coarctata]